MDNLKSFYRYNFSNGDSGTMTPVEAHQYAHKHKVNISEGPNYCDQKPMERFTGWGYHAGLRKTFKGPNHYRSYLRENNLIEAGNEKAPLWEDPKQPPVWNEKLIRKAINDYGIEIGGVMAAALMSGELDYPEQPEESPDDENSDEYIEMDENFVIN